MVEQQSIHHTRASAPVSSFIGRERELAEVADLLRQRRFVTLTGPGGAGKTRLALQAASAARSAFANGVWVIELAPLERPEFVLDTIASVAQAHIANDGSALEALADFFGEKHALLTLDNCEHLLAECARVVAFLLGRCPALVILATSREPLATAGEWVVRVPPLSLPAAAATLETERLLDYDGIRLFVERAQAAEPSFRLSEATAASVVEICRRLDGIPLALELAAIRVRGMGVAILGARLDDRLRLLTAGDRAGEPRQQTLNATVDWSYGLLSAPERQTLRSLGVFMGGFSPEAAEAVCGEALAAEPGADSVLDILARLVDKSLAQFEHDTGLYRLLETIRLYCRQRLEVAGDYQHALRRHFVYYLHLAEDGARLLGGPEQVGWFARIEQEHDNYRVALNWAIEAQRADEAARLALSLWPCWQAKSYQREGLRWLDRIDALDGVRALPPQLRAPLLNAHGVLARMTHQFDRAVAFQQEALRLWAAMGDQQGMAQALVDLSWTAFDEVDVGAAKRFAVEALALAEQGRDKRTLANALLAVAQMEAHNDAGVLFGADMRPEVERARLQEQVSLLERSLALWRELGVVSNEAVTLSILGIVRMALGDIEQAKALLAESARLHFLIGDQGNVNGSLVGLMNLAAKMAGASHDPEMARDAIRIYGALMAIVLRISDQHSPWDASAPARELVERMTRIIGPEGVAQATAEGMRLTTSELLAVLERVARPAQSASAASARAAISRAPAAPHDSLTRREREVLRLVAQGLTNAQVGRELVVTPRTVNAHLTAIYGKLAVLSRSGAIRYAIDHQLG